MAGEVLRGDVEAEREVRRKSALRRMLTNILKSQLYSAFAWSVE